MYGTYQYYTIPSRPVIAARVLSICCMVWVILNPTDMETDPLAGIVALDSLDGAGLRCVLGHHGVIYDSRCGCVVLITGNRNLG